MKLQLTVLVLMIATFALNIAFWRAQNAINADFADRLHTIELQQQFDTPQRSL